MTIIRGVGWFAANLVIAFGVIAFLAGWRIHLQPVIAGHHLALEGTEHGSR